MGPHVALLRAAPETLRQAMAVKALRRLSAIAFFIVATSAQAASYLQVSHLQHFYAGGGGCADRFWLVWNNSEFAITDIELLIEIKSKGQQSALEAIRLERLGINATDNQDEASFEIPQCLSGKPKLKILSASGSIRGQKIDLLANKLLRVGKVTTFPIHFNSAYLRSVGSTETNR